MAIEIINKKFKVRCSQCYTEFTYETSDIKMGSTGKPFVTCPLCKSAHYHDPKDEIPPAQHIKKQD